MYKAGLISYQSGEWILAQKYLSLAATRNDSNPELLYMLAYSYYKMRSYHAAQQNIEKAIALDSSNYNYHLLYGKKYEKISVVDLPQDAKYKGWQSNH